MAFVYCLTNTVNGKKYIGICHRSVRKRFGKHRQSARSSHPLRSRCSALHAAIRKYGVAAFLIETLYEAVDWREACVVERGLIAAYGTRAPRGYNLTNGGDGVLGMRHSEETKRITGLKGRGRKHTAEALALISDASKRAMAVPENRDRIRQSLLGGRRSEESRKRISEAAKARWKVPGYKEKIQAATKGRPLSGAHLLNVKASHKSSARAAKLSTAFKGKKKSEAHAAKLRGQKRTPEQCARIAEGTRAAYQRKIQSGGHGAIAHP